MCVRQRGPRGQLHRRQSRAHHPAATGRTRPSPAAPALRVRGLGFRVSASGFGVWGSEFGVWGLGFRGCGLGYVV